MYVYMYVCMNVCMYACMYVYVYMYVCSLTGVCKQGFSESWRCALRSCKNLCLGIAKPGSSYLPHSTPLWNRFGAVSAVFAGSGGKYLFHRIGWKGRIWQAWSCYHYWFYYYCYNYNYYHYIVYIIIIIIITIIIIAIYYHYITTVIIML